MFGISFAVCIRISTDQQRLAMETIETINFSTTICPFALLDIINRLKGLQPGQEMEIIGLDSDAIRDLTCILPLQACSMHMDIFSRSNEGMAVRIRKGV
jgi:TusA-related sulfurtransferase